MHDKVKWYYVMLMELINIVCIWNTSAISIMSMVITTTKTLYTITNAYPNFNGGLVIPPTKLWHWWVITSHIQHSGCDYLSMVVFKGTLKCGLTKTMFAITICGDHYGDAIMGTMASQITSLTIVYSAVYSVADQRKHQSSVSLAFVRGIHRRPVNSLHKWPVTRKIFPFDDVIMSKFSINQWHDICCRCVILHIISIKYSVNKVE